MKYKVKNITSGEEIICEKVVVGDDDYYILFDDIKKSEKPCYCYNSIEGIWGVGIVFYQGVMPMYHYVGFKKVIATTNKSLDLPIVVDEVEELGESHARWMWGIYYNDIDNGCNETRGSNSISDYKEGYRKAKEIYCYTKEDMVEFTEWLITKSFREGTSDYTTEELLDIWQEQRTIEILVK